MQEELDQMSNSELRAHIVQLKEHYDKMRKYRIQLDQKHQRSVTREGRIVVDQQKQVLQAETLNMMTKYQLVFAKIECQVNRVLNSNKLREMRFAQRAFDKFKANALAQRNREAYRTHMIYLQLQGNVGVRLLQAYQKSRVRSQRRLFDKWRMQAQAASVLERLAKVLKQSLESKKAESEKVVAAL